MKRSEMVDIIEECWKDSTSFPTDNLVAEYILRKIEEAGMLAPLNEQEYHYMDNDDRRLENTWRSFHVWEPEDEVNNANTGI